jgi:hypothetical protein
MAYDGSAHGVSCWLHGCQGQVRFVGFCYLGFGCVAGVSFMFLMWVAVVGRGRDLRGPELPGPDARGGIGRGGIRRHQHLPVTGDLPERGPPHPDLTLNLTLEEASPYGGPWAHMPRALLESTYPDAFPPFLAVVSS